MSETSSQMHFNNVARAHKHAKSSQQRTGKVYFHWSTLETSVYLTCWCDVREVSLIFDKPTPRVRFKHRDIVAETQTAGDKLSSRPRPTPYFHFRYREKRRRPPVRYGLSQLADTGSGNMASVVVGWKVSPQQFVFLK